MTNEKPFHNLEEQIEKLNCRGLIISDENDAKRQLLKTGYYDLVNGYKNMFLLYKCTDTCEDRYINGTTFEDLITLYQLDRELRHIVMRITLDIESNFYTTLAYCIAEIYGEKQADYLIETNYKRGNRQARGGYERDNLFNRIRRRISNVTEHPMKHYKNKYNNVPPWILAKHMSFGELIVWYKLSISDIKDNVVHRFTGSQPTEKLKESFLKSMELFNKFRNRAAHGGRMYNYRTNIEIPYNKDLHKILYIEKDDYNKGIGRSDLTALLLARMHLKKNDKVEYIENIVHLNTYLETYKRKSPLHYNRILDELGLPINYYEQLLKTLEN